MERYARQIAVPQIGKTGQSRLESASVLVIGAGGLGSALLYCLAGAGVGRIGIIDDDCVGESNLNRQFLHTTGDIGRDKTASAAEKLSALNPLIKIETKRLHVDGQNATETVRGWDIVLPAVDNLEARLAVNRACCAEGIPMVNGAVEGLFGWLQTVIPGKTPCLECFYVGQKSGAGGTPVLGASVSVISSLMADAAILLLLGLADPLDGELLCFDGERLAFDRVKLERAPGCPACSGRAEE